MIRPKQTLTYDDGGASEREERGRLHKAMRSRRRLFLLALLVTPLGPFFRHAPYAGPSYGIELAFFVFFWPALALAFIPHLLTLAALVATTAAPESERTLVLYRMMIGLWFLLATAGLITLGWSPLREIWGAALTLLVTSVAGLAELLNRLPPR